MRSVVAPPETRRWPESSAVGVFGPAMRDALSNMEKSALARTPSFHAPPIEDFHKTLAKVGLSASSLPLASCAVAVLTYVTCIILTAALGTYTGGLRMPWIEPMTWAYVLLATFVYAFLTREPQRQCAARPSSPPAHTRPPR